MSRKATVPPERRIVWRYRPSTRAGARLTAAVLLATACDVRDPVIGSSFEQEEDRGTEVPGSQMVGARSSLFWSADGGSVFFEAGTGTVALRAVDALTGQVLTLDGPQADYVDPVVTHADGPIYFSTDRQDGRRDTWLRAGGGAAPVQLTDRAPGTSVLEQADGRLVLPSPDGATTAFIVSPDSLFVHDVTTGASRFIATQCIRVIVYSPDRARVMCRRDAEGDAGFGTVRLADGEVADILLMPRELARIQVIHWDDDAIRTVYRTNSRFRIQNVDRDSTGTLWLPGIRSARSVVDFFNYSWSANGARFAFWTHECLQVNRVGTCTFGQSLLHVVELATNQGRTAVVAKGERGGEQIALSPDGTRVAYVFDQRVWIQVVNGQ
ncbi:MAG: hypothetical protein ACREL7_03685 [Longimicrobiales bacterium]